MKGLFSLNQSFGSWHQGGSTHISWSFLLHVIGKTLIVTWNWNENNKGMAEILIEPRFFYLFTDFKNIHCSVKPRDDEIKPPNLFALIETKSSVTKYWPSQVCYSYQTFRDWSGSVHVFTGNIYQSDLIFMVELFVTIPSFSSKILW